MIYTERKVTIKNDVATIDMPILLFRGDREVEIQFTIIDSKFKFESNRGNVIDKTQATYGQLAVALPDGTDLFTEIVECENGVVIFSISGEMIDEIREVGFYSFHIRLYNDDKTSRITLPPVMKGIEIREPLIIEGDVENTDLVGDATVGYSTIQDRGIEEPVFDENGNYIPTVWNVGDTITAEKLNRIEECISNVSLTEIIHTETTADLIDTARGVATNMTYSNNNYHDFDMVIKSIEIPLTVNATGMTDIDLLVLTPDNIIYDQHNLSVMCDSTGIINVTFDDLDIHVPASSYIAFKNKNSNIANMYQDHTDDSAIYTINLSQDNGWSINGPLAERVLVYTLHYALKRDESSASGSNVSRLTGKKIIAIGDSMVQGYTLSIDESWLAMIARRNNMRHVNYGINGRYLTNKLYGEVQGVVDSFSAMDNDADYIIVFAGTNDAIAEVTIGENDSSNPAEFKGALNLICDGLLTKYPTKAIMFITPYYRNDKYLEYIQAIEDICAKYSIPVFNNAKNGGICWRNAAQQDALTIDRNVHLNAAGMEFASYRYEAFLKNL